MSVRVGINGFGRIGRNYLRRALQQGHTVAAVNCGGAAGLWW